MSSRPIRETVDLKEYPDLILILLGIKLHRWRALSAMRRLGRGLSAVRSDPPEGLLGEERCLFGWNHFGFRQYWRDPDSLERFTRSSPHADWWRAFMQDMQGCGFWHEAYSARGGVEAVYVGMDAPLGLGAFAPIVQPVGPLMSGRGRLQADRNGRMPEAA